MALLNRIELAGTNVTSILPAGQLQTREGAGGHPSRLKWPSSNHSRPLYFTLLSPVPVEWKVTDNNGSGNGTSQRYHPSLRFRSYAYLHGANSFNQSTSTPVTDLKTNGSAPAVKSEDGEMAPLANLVPLVENATFTSRPFVTPTVTPTTSSTLRNIVTRLCEKLTDRQKYDLLEGVGGRNQQFMANSPSEAAHYFSRLLPADHQPSAANDFSAGDEVPNFDDVPGNEDDAVEDGEPLFDPAQCDAGWCHEIEWKLADALDRREESANGSMLSRSHFDEPEPAPREASLSHGSTGDDGKGSNKQRSGPNEETVLRLKKKPSSRCFLEKFIPIGNCTSHGEEEIWGHEKLCTACQGVYVLNDDCFPTFINAVICDKYDTKCIFDRYSGAAQGKCQTKSLSYKVMRNKGDEDGCEKWVFEYLEVPVACECHLSKTSWLEAQPPPPEVRTR